MQYYRSSGLGALPLVLFFLATPMRAADNWVKYESQPGSKMKLEGTSTIHDWTVESSIIAGTMELETATDADLKSLKVKPKVEVTIPVRSLKSGKGAMDAVMQDAMKMKQYPKIEYRLLAMTPKGENGSSYQYDAKGALTVSGVTKTNTMVVTLERLDKTKIKVTGTTRVKMTDHGISPPSPTIGLGLIKTSEDVKITFEWLTAQSADAPKAP
jgi:polyisoprenoid-binding protein YceI